jgi:hypothetical protein
LKEAAMSEMIVTDVSPRGNRQRDPGAPVEAQRKRGDPPTEAQLQQLRRDTHAATHATHAADAAAAKATDTAAADTPREDLDSVEFELPDGRTIILGPPPGIALQIRISNMLGPKLDAYTAALYRALLSVRQVGSELTRPLVNEVDAQALANKIGEDGVDLCILAMNKYWPPVTTKDLRIVKKNPR